jgi:pyridoxine 5-phosphate synthase
MARLGFNVEGVALWREAAGTTDADPVQAAFLAELGGADLLVCPINDEFRPLAEKDLRLLKALAKIPINVQMPVSEKAVSVALALRPASVTLLPGGKSDATPQGGLNPSTQSDELGKCIREFRSQAVVVGCFVEPLVPPIKAAAAVNADYVELSVQGYASAPSAEARNEWMEQLRTGILAAAKLGLGVALSRGIHYRNALILAGLERVEEVHVGRAIIARSILIGMEQAVRDMAALVH